MPTMEDRLIKRQKTRFAARGAEIMAFRNLLSGSDVEYNILNYIGIGGIGKTSLLFQFKDICKDELNIPVAMIDAVAQENVTDALVVLASDLESCQVNLTRFRQETQRYLDLQSRLEQDSTVPQEFVRFLSKSVSLGGVPHGSDKDADSRVNIDAEQARIAIYRVLKREDADFYLSPEQVLTIALVEGVNEKLRTRPICIILDRYELILDSLDTWFREDLFSRLEEKAVIVVAGRVSLKEGWQKWQPLTLVTELRLFNEKETAELLSLYDISDQQLTEQIHKFAGGLPLAIASAASLVHDGVRQFAELPEKHDVVAELVKTLTREISPDLDEILEACAVLRWFNEDILSEFIDSKTLKNLYPRVRGLSFVRPHSLGLALHDRVRDFINEDLSYHNPKRFSQLHKKAADFFEQRKGKDQLDQRRALIEVIYHKVRADENEGIVFTVDLFNNVATLFQVEFCEIIYDTVKDVPRETDNVLWLKYFEGVVAKLKAESLEAERILKEVLQQPKASLNRKLQVCVGRWLAGSLWFAGKFDEVLKYANETLRLARELKMTAYEHMALETIGLALDRMGEFQRAIDAELELERASRLANDRVSEAWALNNAGYFYYHLGDWDQAEEYLLKCREIAVELGSLYIEVYPLGHVGLLYALLGDYEKAMQNLTDCLSMSLPAKSREMECKAHQNLATLARLQGDYERGQQHAHTAVDLARAMVHPYYEADALRIWGENLIEQGKHEEAASKLLQSLTIASKIKGRYIEARDLVSLHFLKTVGAVDDQTFEYKNVLDFLAPFPFARERSRLHMICAKQLLRQGNVQEGKTLLADACTYALLYNRFWLDITTEEIVQMAEDMMSNKKAKIAMDICNHLIHFWESGKVGDRALQELEEESRRRGRIPKGKTTRFINRLKEERETLFAYLANNL